MEAQPKTRVLIVDDDQTLCDMYAERLKAEGFEVVVANNGEEGVAKATQYMPNVILLDLMMPKVNGFNALEILKSTEATKDIPVLLLTALIQEENKRRGLQAGAEDYIIKSESMPGDVIVKIKTAVEKSKQAKARAAGAGAGQQAQSSVGTPTPAGGAVAQPTPPVTPETPASVPPSEVTENNTAPTPSSPVAPSPVAQPPMEPYKSKAPSDYQPATPQEPTTASTPLSTDTSSSPTPPPPQSEEPPMPPGGQA